MIETEALEAALRKLMRPTPGPYWTVRHCDTHEMLYESSSAVDVFAFSRHLKSPSEYYVTEYFGDGRDDDEIIEQISVDEWLADHG